MPHKSHTTRWSYTSWFRILSLVPEAAAAEVFLRGRSISTVQREDVLEWATKNAEFLVFVVVDWAMMELIQCADLKFKYVSTPTWPSAWSKGHDSFMEGEAPECAEDVTAPALFEHTLLRWKDKLTRATEETKKGLLDMRGILLTLMEGTAESPVFAACFESMRRTNGEEKTSGGTDWKNKKIICIDDSFMIFFFALLQVDPSVLKEFRDPMVVTDVVGLFSEVSFVSENCSAKSKLYRNLVRQLHSAKFCKASQVRAGTYVCVLGEGGWAMQRVGGVRLFMCRFLTLTPQKDNATRRSWRTRSPRSSPTPWR